MPTLPAQAWEWNTSFPTLFSVEFCLSVVSNSLQSHVLQHARPPCPSPTPGVYSDSRPLIRWCHLTISSSVPFCPQSFPASGPSQISQFFASGQYFGQSTGVSPSASILPVNILDWFPLQWTGWISLALFYKYLNHLFELFILVILVKTRKAWTKR